MQELKQNSRLSQLIILLSLPGHDVIVASARSIGIEFTWNYPTFSQKPGKVEKGQLELNINVGSKGVFKYNMYI